MATRSFQGFPVGIISFFEDLGGNNNKAWFDANKRRYEECVKEPALAFGELMAEKLADIAAGPPPEASPFRIYRDIRFSKDKSPYKTHMGIPFGDPGYKKGESPGFYFHLDARQLIVGAGLYSFDKPVLEAYRQAVLHEESGARLALIVADLTDQGYDIWGRTYKRVPRGYDPEHPRTGLLLHSGLFAGLAEPPLPELHSPEIIDYCLEHYRNLAPLQHWLVELTQSAG